MNVLYVENHEHFSKAVKNEFLKDMDVTVSPTVESAIQYLNEKEFDVVLVDYDLDDGKGSEVIRYIRDRDINTKTIAVSSHKKGNDHMASLGANAVCEKMRFKNILNTIHEVLSE